jgi:hypothetical protein
MMDEKLLRMFRRANERADNRRRLQLVTTLTFPIVALVIYFIFVEN